jgi:hypothetical protein
MVSQDGREPGRITPFDHTDTSVPASVVRERYRHMRNIVLSHIASAMAVLTI